MSNNSLVTGWPGAPAAVAFRLDGTSMHRAVEIGDLSEVRPWASVSKLAVSYAFGVEFDWESCKPSTHAGPVGSFISNMLSHSSGLGLEEGDPTTQVGKKRIYSNVAVNTAVKEVIEDHDPANWLRLRVFEGLGMNSTSLQGRPSDGVTGSTEDLVTFAKAWLLAQGISESSRNRLITPYAPQLDGIVPGFGSFSPCPWGLGPEVRGTKEHWMGDWPEDSFGHFGKSGALMLMNLREKIAVVATSTVEFGPWAVELWPQWTSEMRKRALGS